MKDLNADRIASAGLTDKNILVYLEIERAIKGRNPELALTRLGEELVKTAEEKFKDILLRQRFWCSLRLNRFAEAKDAAEQMLLREPANFYMALNECSLIENRSERLEYLEELKERHPFSAPVLNAYAIEVCEALEKRDKVKSPLRSEDLVDTLNRSLDIDPSLDNGAWVQLFKFYSKQGPTKNRDLLAGIVDKHLARDAFSPRTTAMLFRFCRNLKTTDYKGKQLFQYLQEAYTNHFPRDYAAHLDIFVDACIEFEGHRLLRPLLEEARNKEELKEDPQFATLMMSVYYDVFRDLSGAISYGREFVRTNRQPTVELKLLHFCIANQNPQKARDLHSRLKGALDHGVWLQLEAKILEVEQRYQDAIDTIQNIPDKRDFKERYTSVLAFLDLKCVF